MRIKVAVALIFAFASLVAYGDSRPSGGLLFNAFANHFVQYFCISRFPGMKPEILGVFEQSRLKLVEVPCMGLKCSDPQITRDLQALWKDSKQLPSEDALKMCSTYAETLRATESGYEDELNELFRKRAKP